MISSQLGRDSLWVLRLCCQSVQLPWRCSALICLLCMQNFLLLTLSSLLLPLFLLLFSPSLQCISQHQSPPPTPPASSPCVFVTSGCRDSSPFAFSFPSSSLSSLLPLRVSVHRFTLHLCNSREIRATLFPSREMCLRSSCDL